MQRSVPGNWRVAKSRGSFPPISALIGPLRPPTASVVLTSIRKLTLFVLDTFEIVIEVSRISLHSSTGWRTSTHPVIDHSDA